jgi:hypothetical protein
VLSVHKKNGVWPGNDLGLTKLSLRYSFICGLLAHLTFTGRKLHLL